jgi:uncharacterized protein (DUF1778 family)
VKKRNWGGRPRGKPKPGHRVPLSIRVTPRLKELVDEAAEESGRSQSQEVEYRLERSFDRQELLLDVLTNAFGQQTAELLVVLGRALRATEGLTRSMVIRGGGSVVGHGGGRVDLGSGGSIVSVTNAAAFSGAPWAGDWLHDPAAYELAAKAVGSVLERFRPPGDKAPSAELAAALKAVGWENFSEHLADYVVAEGKRKMEEAG